VKIAIGSRPYAGPWGGGNRFATALCDALAGAGHAVVHDLADRDIDVILLTDPRPRSPHVGISPGAIGRRLALQGSRALVVHRINECDERKAERFINHKLARANYLADATVFVGEWLTHLPVWKRSLRDPWFVIRNGADTALFNRDGHRDWSGEGPLKLVTHHWGYHPMKGFDVYAEIDRMLTRPEWNGRIAFTYVGNLPKGFAFANARYVPPLDGVALAGELRAHHVYVTGSLNEPGGNHQNEGALCGLPLLYRESGCLPEYCSGFGVPFHGVEDFPASLAAMLESYQTHQARMPSYPHTAERMCTEWIDLFEKLVARRDELVGARRLYRDPWTFLANQWPL